jgi:transcriptional regulator with XRE-family HTH domain
MESVLSSVELIQSGKSKEIGERIRTLREAMVGPGGQSISQEMFGIFLKDLSLPKINRVENGRRMPDIDFILRLRELTGCDLNWLLTGEGGDEQKSVASAKRTLLSMLQTDPEFRAEVMQELGVKPASEVARNDRIYKMLQAQRDDWTKIVETTMTSVSRLSEAEKKEAEEKIRGYRDGIAYLNVLLNVGRKID